MQCKMYVTEKVVNGIRAGNSTTPCISVYGVVDGKRTVVAPKANRYDPVGLSITIDGVKETFVMRDHAVIWPKHQTKEGKKVFFNIFQQLAEHPGDVADVECEIVEVVQGGGSIKLNLGKEE